MKILGNRMKDRVQAREAVTIPTYTITKQKRKIPKWVLITASTVLVFFTTIYLPPMLIEEADMTTRGSVDLRSVANVNAMEWAYGYLRNHPEDDFDKDGLTNEEEVAYNTGIYLIDNDDDGTTDYAELYLTETNPSVPDEAIINFVKQADAKTGNTVNTPFRLHGLILWADDYESKARSGVVPLADGSYNFYRFCGWVQFPAEITEAYAVHNGVQSALKKNDAGYFYIEAKELLNVRVYEEAPERCHILSLLGNRYSLGDNLLSKTLSFVLPSNGFGLITCKPALVNDTDETWQEVAVTNDPVTIKLGEYSEDRFGRDQQLLTDLSNIFTQIDNGNNVIISLMSHEVGEVFVEVYGYTSRNNLLICDPETGESYGVLNVEVIGERVLDQTGKISSYEHYTFNGCGYSSAQRHRLMIVDIIRPQTTPMETKTQTPPVVDEQSTQE